jgi:1,4-dihydroxy-2-naphthoyl-CoA hydrolase
MAIWFHENLTVDTLQSFGKNNMVEHLGILFTEIGENYIKATMPVDHRTTQTYGILHGGASVSLAETIGSIAAALVIDNEKYYCVGLEINANHIRSVRKGFVTGISIPIHIGRKTHVWEIKMYDVEEKLICICRLTVAILLKEENIHFGT